LTFSVSKSGRSSLAFRFSFCNASIHFHLPVHLRVASSDVWLDTKIIGPGDRWNQPSLRQSMRSWRQRQLSTDLRLADKRLGLLIDFHVVLTRTASSALSMDSKKRFTPSRQAAKTRRETATPWDSRVQPLAILS
jgi:hypothetical protein